MRLVLVSLLLTIALVGVRGRGRAQEAEIEGTRPACVSVSWTGGFRGGHLRVANACVSPVRCSLWAVAPGSGSAPFHTVVLPSGADDEQSFIGMSPTTLDVDCRTTDI